MTSNVELGRELIYQKSTVSNNNSPDQITKFRQDTGNCLKVLNESLKALHRDFAKLGGSPGFSYNDTTGKIDFNGSSNRITPAMRTANMRTHALRTIKDFTSAQFPAADQPAVEAFLTYKIDKDRTRLLSHQSVPRLEKLLQKVASGTMKSQTDKQLGADNQAKAKQLKTLEDEYRDINLYLSNNPKPGLSLASLGLSSDKLLNDITKAISNAPSINASKRLQEIEGVIQQIINAPLTVNPLKPATLQNLPVLPTELNRFVIALKGIDTHLANQVTEIQNRKNRLNDLFDQIRAIDPKHPFLPISAPAPIQLPQQPLPPPQQPLLIPPQAISHLFIPLPPAGNSQPPAPPISQPAASTGAAPTLRGRVSCCSRLKNWFATVFKTMGVSLKRFFCC